MENRLFDREFARFPCFPSALENGGGVAERGKAVCDGESVGAGEVGAIKQDWFISGDGCVDLRLSLVELFLETSAWPVDGARNVSEIIVEARADVEDQRLAGLLELEKRA